MSCSLEVFSGASGLNKHSRGLNTLGLLGCNGHGRVGYDVMVCIIVYYVGQAVW